MCSCYLYRKTELETLKADLAAANKKIIDAEVSCAVDNFKAFGVPLLIFLTHADKHTWMRTYMHLGSCIVVFV